MSLGHRTESLQLMLVQNLGRGKTKSLGDPTSPHSSSYLRGLEYGIVKLLTMGLCSCFNISPPNASENVEVPSTRPESQQGRGGVNSVVGAFFLLPLSCPRPQPSGALKRRAVEDAASRKGVRLLWGHAALAARRSRREPHKSPGCTQTRAHLFLSLRTSLFVYFECWEVHVMRRFFF